MTQRFEVDSFEQVPAGPDAAVAEDRRRAATASTLARRALEIARTLQRELAEREQELAAARADAASERAALEARLDAELADARAHVRELTAIRAREQALEVELDRLRSVIADRREREAELAAQLAEARRRQHRAEPDETAEQPGERRERRRVTGFFLLAAATGVALLAGGVANVLH